MRWSRNLAVAAVALLAVGAALSLRDDPAPANRSVAASGPSPAVDEEVPPGPDPEVAPGSPSDVSVLEGRVFVRGEASGVVAADRWQVPRNGRLWDIVERRSAVHLAASELGPEEVRRRMRALQEERWRLLEELASSPQRKRALAIRTAVLAYRFHAVAEMAEPMDALEAMVSLELDIMTWLHEAKDDAGSVDGFFERARPWCEHAAASSDPGLQATGQACLEPRP